MQNISEKKRQSFPQGKALTESVMLLDCLDQKVRKVNFLTFRGNVLRLFRKTDLEMPEQFRKEKQFKR